MSSTDTNVTFGTKLAVVVNTSVGFPTKDFSEENLEMLKEALSFPTPGRERARREQVFGWQSIPAKTCMVSVDENMVYIPRGYLREFLQGLKELEIDFKVLDWRPYKWIDTSKWKKIDLRGYQNIAETSLIAYQQGIYKAPTGAGKSEVVLSFIRLIAQKSIVIVEKKALLEQWKSRAEEHLGIEVGVIDGDREDIKDLTIAMQQSLWSRKDEYNENGFFQQFGCVVCDEVHHLESPTLMQLVQEFPAFYRIGVSATPDRNYELWPFVQTVIGPVIAETPDEEVIDQGFVLKPTVRSIDTEYHFNYIATHDHEKCPGEECPHFGELTKKGTPRIVHRNNYQDLLADLEVDKDRNGLICWRLWDTGLKGRCQLVVSRRLKHLDLLLTRMKEVGYPPELLHRLTGREGAEERREVISSVQDGSVIFSTIANEALDIPRLDTIHLVYPGKNPKVIQQQVGRICRPHDDKVDAIVFDYVDSKCSVLRNQYFSRKNGFYDEKGIQVIREREE